MRLRHVLGLALALTTGSVQAQTSPVQISPVQISPVQISPVQAPAAPAPSQAQPQAVPAGPAARTTLAPGPGDPTNVEDVVLAAQAAAILTGTSTWDDGFITLKGAFGRIEDALVKAGIPLTGRPVAVFVHTDDAGFRYEAMVPVASVPEGRTELNPEIRFGTTPAGKSLRFVHKDAYDEIDGTYETITAYLDAKDIVAKDAFIEEYVTDLTDAADTNLEVNIYVQPKD
jgi:effector-binding domain-containing protein